MIFLNKENKLKVWYFLLSFIYHPPWTHRKMDKESTVVLHQAGMLRPQKGAVRFLLENFPGTFLRMNSYHCVKKWVQI